MRRVIIMIILAAICSSGLAAASAREPGGAPAPLGAAKDRTDLDVFGFDSNGEIKTTPAGGNDWSLRWPGYNIIRTLTNRANKRLLLLLNGYTGEAQTFELNADGSVGKSPWWTAQNPIAALRCTNADIIRMRDRNTLITQDALTGTVRTFTLNEDGSPMASYTEKILEDMEDKNLFQVYYSSEAGYQMIGVDTWTGSAVVYWLNMQKSAQATWARGWTSLDSLYLNGARFRLLYKAAGDPYRNPDPEVVLRGQFVVQVVGSDGIAAQTIQDIAFGGEYSSVRFVELPASVDGARNIAVLFYNRTTGQFALYGFNPQSGIDGSALSTGSFVEPDLSVTPYTDLQPCVVEGKTYLAFVSADGTKPLSYEKANAFGQAIYTEMNDKTVGYQFALAQSGRTMYRQAWGKLRLDHLPPFETDMTTHSQLEIGSVSKMITALTVLKLAEQGLINLSDPIANYLAQGQAGQDSWARWTPVRNLLTHTSGVSSNSCTLDASTGKVNCAPFFAKTQDPNCNPNAPGGFNCNRSYNGSNYRALRKVIEFVTNTETSSQITDKTHDLWANDIGLGEITCRRNPHAFYYGPCNGAQDCYYFNNKDWQREQQTDVDQDNWLPACSSRHWYASSRELMAFLGAVRYRQILKNSAFTEFLLSTDLYDVGGVPGSTAVSWEAPVPVSGGNMLGKAGNLPLPNSAARAYIARLPYNCDVVVQLNTVWPSGSTSVPTLVQNTYQAIVP